MVRHKITFKNNPWKGKLKHLTRDQWTLEIRPTTKWRYGKKLKEGCFVKTHKPGNYLSTSLETVSR